LNRNPANGTGLQILISAFQAVASGVMHTTVVRRKLEREDNLFTEYFAIAEAWHSR
jgi:hypothetical protein